MEPLTEPELLAALEEAARAPSNVGAETMRQILTQAVAAIEASPEALALPKDATVQERIVAVMRAIGAVGKDQTMSQGESYRYRGIDSILERAHPALCRFGLVLYPTVQEADYDERTSRSGSRMTSCHLTVEWGVVGTNGDRLVPSPVTVGEAFDSSDKATNKAQTAAFKLLLGQLFAIPYSEPDQDAERHELGDEPEPEAPPTEEQAEAQTALAELLDHAPDEVIADLTDAYHRRVWQGRKVPWEDCPPGWAPVILDGARQRLARWEEEQEAATAAEGHLGQEANGALVPTVTEYRTEDVADATDFDSARDEAHSDDEPGRDGY